jgi:hypothetical protein
MRVPPELEEQILARPDITVNGGKPIERPELPEADGMTHKVFQKAITDLAERNAWDWHHQTVSKKSKEGWPDLMLFRERIVAIEVKVEPDKPTAAQLRWLDIINAAGGEAFVAYPADWAKVVEVLTRRKA